MLDDFDYQEEPLDFEAHHRMCRCPYCGESLSAEEVEGYFTAKSNIFVCPNCRKKLNAYDLGGNI